MTHTVASSLARAALKIANANHYMVGFNVDSTAEISFEDFSDAHRLLVDMELRNAKRQHRYDIAFTVLGELCFKQHRTHLSR
jgi:hypothetical protein